MTKALVTEKPNTESTARQQLRAVLDCYGLELTGMEWEPISAGAEKSGPEGGWTAWAKERNGDREYTAVGYNLIWLAFAFGHEIAND